MHEKQRSRLFAYGVAVLGPALTMLIRGTSMPVLDDRARYIIFCPAIMVAAYVGGLWPGLVASLVSAAAIKLFLIPPHHSFWIESEPDALALGCFVLIGALISGLSESLHRSRHRVAASERRYAVTLASIGDAIIATDLRARITFLNPVAESLTGWPLADAVGRPLAEVFRIIHEQTRQPVEDPAAKVLRLGTLVGLANHTALLARDDREVPIDDCGAPIVDDRGAIAGVVVVFRDVTQRRKADEAEAFRRANERLELALRGSSVGVWDIEMRDGDLRRGQRHYVNVWEQLGYEGRPAGGTTLDVAHPEDRDRAEEAALRYLAGETTEYETETRLRHMDGSYRIMLGRGVAARDAAGKPIRFIGVTVDITQLKLAEEELRRTTALLQGFVDGTQDAVYVKDREGRHLMFNAAGSRMVGKTIESVLGQDDTAIFDSDSAREVMAHDRQVMESGAATTIEHQLSADGVTRTFLSSKAPYRDGRGNVVGLIGLCHDITDRKHAEEALRESEERFRGTFENAAVGIVHNDSAGRFLRVNEKFCAIVGYSREELLQKTLRDVVHVDDLAPFVELYMSCFARGEAPPAGMERRYLRKDGSTVWVEVFASFQRDESGRPAYAIAAVQDVTERKRLADELRQAKEAAEAANRAKDEFLANVSHEIRTPMNAILGMAGLALDSELTEYQQQCLTTVKTAGDNLLIIINDLLDFAKIEAGKLELDLADFSLRSTVGETLRSLAVRAHKKGLELIYDVHPDVPDALVGDAGRLRQVLLNLVGNAIKFTDEGEVVVRLEMDNESGAKPPDVENVSLRFTVRDTGIGIPRDNQERIFRAFEQEDTSTTRKYGGTGLGLTISARLVALMNGKITVESESNDGSTFAFTATFSRQPKPTPQVAVRPPIDVHDLRVLVVDDNATNRRILEAWLQDWQMKPTAVGSGAAALDALLHSAASGSRYEFVLLDYQMPEIDGLALTAKIRALPELQQPCIILLTSSERGAALSRMRELQISAYLLKPIEQEQLLETIVEAMSRADENTEPAKRPIDKADVKLGASSRPLRVLVAEDNEFNAELLKQLLARRGHDVKLATDGREALKAVQGEQFDLLLLDVHMPEMDGFQVVKVLREHERESGGHLPVIALTARSREEDREHCLAAGMDDFLAKPIHEPDLWTAIDRLIGKQPNESESDSELLSAKILLSACGRDAKILAKLCDAFKDGLPDYMSTLRGALRNGESSRMRVAAHKLCALLGTFSTKAGGLASQIEDLAAAARLEECRPLVDQLEQLSQDVLKRVDQMTIETLQN